LVAPDTWTKLIDDPARPVIETTITDDVHGLIYGLSQGLDEGWVLPLTGSPTWIPLNLSAAHPAGRYAAATAYDPVSDRVLVYGGYDGGNKFSDDLWALSMDDVTAVEMSLLSADATSARVALTWFASAGAGTEASVERRPADGVWITIGQVQSDGRGYLAFEDDNVVPGMRYAYRLVYGDGG